MTRMEERKGKTRDKMRFWKGKIPKDLEKFYRDLYCEWKKYKVTKFHGDLLKDLTQTIDSV